MGTGVAVGATATGTSKMAIWDKAVADKLLATNALAASKLAYDNKVAAAATAKPFRDTGVLATREKDSAATLVSR